MEEIETSLIEIGLTRTEARIYLAGLTFDFVTIQELNKKTGIKRPTLYHAINTLAEKGLAAEKRIAGKLCFSMSPPLNMKRVIEQRMDAIESQKKKIDALIPLLSQEHASRSRESVGVVQYTGIEGMKMVLDIAFHSASRRWDVIAPIKNFLREYDKDYAKRYLNVRKYHGIISRTLWEFPRKGARELTGQEIKERNPRFMPVIMQGKFQSMMILFDDKIAIFSSYDKLSAILITSQELHAMFQAMFDGLWEVSETYI